MSLKLVKGQIHVRGSGNTYGAIDITDGLIAFLSRLLCYSLPSDVFIFSCLSSMGHLNN